MDLCREDIVTLYNSGYNGYEIGKLLNIGRSTVYRHLESNGIKPNRYKYVDIVLSYEQEQVFIGHTLGDGNINYNGTTQNCGGSWAHCIEQKEYFMWKYNHLKDLCGKIREYEIINKRYSKPSYQIRTSYNHNPYLTDIYNKFYINKRKILSNEILHKIDSLALATLFMDDGGKADTTYNICLNNFTRVEVENFCIYLMDKFNVETTINKKNVVRIRMKSRDIFTEIIKPHIIPSMNYKLHPIVLKKQGELLENPQSEDNQQPSLSSNTLEGSTTNSQILNKDGNADTSSLLEEMSLIDIMRPLQHYNNHKFFGDDIV